MTSVHFVVYPIPGTEDQLNERIKELADKINRFGHASSLTLSNFKNSSVKQCVIGPNHIAFLLEDGRVCRVAFSILSERLDLNKTDSNKGPFYLHGSRLLQKGNSSSQANTRQPTRSRGRIIRTTTGRGRGSGVIMGTRSAVPAPFVPEELVSQAQVVLQGKSRNLIIRELQRTNLDVNLAVNNLLSRDDEEGEDVDDSQDSYMPGAADDLISLLDAGMHPDHPSVIIDADAMFSEDMFSFAGLRSRASSRGRTVGERDREQDRDRERESVFRFRERQYNCGSRRWLETALRDSAVGLASDKDGMTENKKKDFPVPSPIWLGEDVEFWPEKGSANPPRFSSIAAMYSELVAIGVNGQLYQWKWSENEPYVHPVNPIIHHPKTISLGLINEKIVKLATSNVRATAATESGKVCTWVDEALFLVANKLEHAAQVFTEFQVDRIASLHVCSLYSCARLESGALYWWGVVPFAQVKKMWDKARAKAKKNRSTSLSSEITAGSQVCFKNTPMHHAGSIAFTIVNGVPKVGQLLPSAWNLNDSCRFKILMPQAEKKTDNKADIKSQESKSDKTDMPPPPSPASSTCSDTGSLTGSAAKRLKTKNVAVVEEVEKKDEEEWQLKNVYFVDDVRSAPIGRVLKVDGMYAEIGRAHV